MPAVSGEVEVGAKLSKHGAGDASDLGRSAESDEEQVLLAAKSTNGDA
jgi:hypothetical protein